MHVENLYTTQKVIVSQPVALFSIQTREFPGLDWKDIFIMLEPGLFSNINRSSGPEKPVATSACDMWLEVQVKGGRMPGFESAEPAPSIMVTIIRRGRGSGDGDGGRGGGGGGGVTFFHVVLEPFWTMHIFQVFCTFSATFFKRVFVVLLHLFPRLATARACLFHLFSTFSAPANSVRCFARFFHVFRPLNPACLASV